MADNPADFPVTFQLTYKLTIPVNLVMDSAIDLESAALKSPIWRITLVSGVIMLFNKREKASAVSIFKSTYYYY